MKPITIFALASTAAATSYSDFLIPNLKTHQPNGQKFDYYEISFNVTSQNGETPSTSWCRDWWGDDSSQTPVNKWIPCTTEYLGDVPSDMSFKLPKELLIGDFDLALRQNLTEIVDGVPSNTILTTDPYHFSNTTSSVPYNCTISTYDNGFNIHSGGDCATTSPLSVPISDASPACQHATSVLLSFPIQVRTDWGESIYIVGSIPELGEWDLSRAVPLNADSYSDRNQIWGGGDVKVAAGTTFEWKSVQKNADGTWLWECGDNWVAEVDEFTCGEQTIGSNPTWFACGKH